MAPPTTTRRAPPWLNTLLTNFKNDVIQHLPGGTGGGTTSTGTNRNMAKGSGASNMKRSGTGATGRRSSGGATSQRRGSASG